MLYFTDSNNLIYPLVVKIHTCHKNKALVIPVPVHTPMRIWNYVALWR